MDIRGVSGLWKVHSPNPIFGLDWTALNFFWTGLGLKKIVWDCTGFKKGLD